MTIPGDEDIEMPSLPLSFAPLFVRIKTEGAEIPVSPLLLAVLSEIILLSLFIKDIPCLTLLDAKLFNIKTTAKIILSSNKQIKNYDREISKNAKRFKNQMIQIYILITTYNRPEYLKKLLDAIYKNKKKNHRLIIQVYDDGSEKKYDFIKKYKVGYKKTNHYGKKGYWKLINYAFSKIRNTDYDYYIQIPDDVTLEDNFINKAIASFEAINDRKKIALNLLLDKGRRGKKNWTGFKPIRMSFHGMDFYRTQWIDMCYIAKRNFFEELRFRIDAIDKSRWEIDRLYGSGVGAQISIKLKERGFNMYQVFKTLVYHGDHVSLMNPKERKINRLVT